MIDWITDHVIGVIPVGDTLAARVTAEAEASEAAYAAGNTIGAIADAELAAQFVHLISGDVVHTNISLFGFSISETGPHESFSLQFGADTHASAVANASASGGPSSLAVTDTGALVINHGLLPKSFAFAFAEAQGANSQTSATTALS
jgi:hypothetical protein